MKQVSRTLTRFPKQCLMGFTVDLWVVNQFRFFSIILIPVFLLVFKEGGMAFAKLKLNKISNNIVNIVP